MPGSTAWCRTYDAAAALGVRAGESVRGAAERLLS
jgi:hypothetical protein